MIGDEDVYAVLVSANTFELVDVNGNTVAEFGTLPAEPILWPNLPRYGIDMAHLDPGVLNSAFGWTVSTPANTAEDEQAVGLIGPAELVDTTRLEAPQIVLTRRSNPPSAAPDLASAFMSGGRVNGSGRPIPSVELTATPTEGRATVSADYVNLGAGINLEIGAGVPAYLLVAMQSRNASADVTYVAGSALGVSTFVPGTLVQFNNLIAGDLVALHWTADIRFTTGAAVPSNIPACFIAVNAFANGAAILPNRFAWTWNSGRATTVPTLTDAAGFSQSAVYQVPANGLYQFDIRSQLGNSNAFTGGASAAVSASLPGTTLTVLVYRTHV